MEKDIPWEKYKSKLPVAHKIYDKLFGKPETGYEIANGFNIRCDIIRILIEEDKNKEL